MLTYEILSAIIIGGVIVAALVYWFKERLVTDVIHTIQGMVDKMKEYELDARAGLMVCRGSDLNIYYMDASLQKLLGNVMCVNDILPESMREKHRRIVARYVGPQPLPDSLNHPLRNVQILGKDEVVVNAKLIIGKLGFRQKLLSDFFYVIIQVTEAQRMKKFRTISRSSSSSFSRKNSSTEHREQEPLHLTDHKSETTAGSSREASPLEDDAPPAQIDAADPYGTGAASHIERGVAPAAERFDPCGGLPGFGGLANVRAESAFRPN